MMDDGYVCIYASRSNGCLEVELEGGYTNN